MQKKYFILTLLMVLSNSCCNDYEKIVIRDFSKTKEVILTPCEWKIKSPIHSYTSFIIKVKGHVNDTIKIKGEYNLKLSNIIDTIFNGDYYGTHDVICVFDPYKATEGELEIEFSL